MVELDDKHFMMIEPKDSIIHETNDDVTEIAHKVMRHASRNYGYGYKGFHVCACGKNSDNHDWVMPDGRITNSLAFHYIQCHRAEVPRTELGKLLVYAKEFKLI